MTDQQPEQTVEEKRDAELRRWALVETAFDHLDDGFSVFDVDLRLVAWNRRFLELVDFPVEGFAHVGTPFEAFIRYNAERGEYGPGEVETQIAERVAKARSFLTHRFERERPNGTVIEIRGNPLPGGGFITVYKDITDQRRAERALKESHDHLENRVERRTAELRELNERLLEEMAERKRVHEALREREAWIRLVADTVPALIGYVDETRRYRFANRSYQSWFGLTPDDIIGRRVEDVLGQTVYRSHRRHVDTALAGESSNWEFPLVTPDGRSILASASFIPHMDEAGRVLGYVVLGQDVTEQRRIEALMRQAQKMEAIGQLTGGLSHDFNNLLTIIIGNLSVLAEQSDEDDPARQLFDPALGAARRGAGLVKRLLAFARRQPLQPKALDVGRLIEGMSDLFHRALGGSADLSVELPPDLWAVRADPHQLENAILNLVINARDAMPEGGRVAISAGNAVLGRAAAARNPEAQAGEYVMISVIDDGTGMPSNVAERVFEPFFTTKPMGRGSGLGLSMVYGFIRQSDGFVEIDTAPGAGTTVRLALPRETAAPAPPPVAADPDIPGGSEHLLVVEDDPDVRRFAATALRSLGYRVSEAASGLEARTLFDALIERTGPIDLVITDVEMPGGVGGLDLAAFARSRLPDVPILYVSGYTERMLPGPTADGGLCLAKPFDKTDLARAVRELIDDAPERRP